MTILKGKVTSAKEDGGMVWLHISGWAGSGWVGLSRLLFANAYQKPLTKQLYGKHNRMINRNIKRLHRQIKILRKEKGSEHAVKDREYQIHSLRGQIKTEVHMHDLVGKRIDLRIL